MGVRTRMILASQFSRLSLEPCICPRCRSDITGRATDMEQFLRFMIVCQSLSSFVSSSMLWLFLYSFIKGQLMRTKQRMKVVFVIATKKSMPQQNSKSYLTPQCNKNPPVNFELYHFRTIYKQS